MRKKKIRNVLLIALLAMVGYSAYTVWRINRNQVLREEPCFEIINHVVKNEVMIKIQSFSVLGWLARYLHIGCRSRWSLGDHIDAIPT